MDTLKNKLIIYDDTCGLCTELRDLVIKSDLFPAEKLKGYFTLDDTFRKKINASRFQNEMAIIDTGEEVTLYGEKALAWLFSGKHFAIEILFRVPGVIFIFGFLYRILARNRFYIFPPAPTNIRCANHPPVHVGYNLIFLVINVSLAILFTMIFERAMAELDLPYTIFGPFKMLIFTAFGWGLLFLIAGLLDLEGLWDYVLHSSALMVMGAAVLLPGAMAIIATGLNVPGILIASVGVSFFLMFRMHNGRRKFLELAEYRDYMWALCLLAGGLAATFMFIL